jgi:hypothetical protein
MTAPATPKPACMRIVRVSPQWVRLYRKRGILRGWTPRRTLFVVAQARVANRGYRTLRGSDGFDRLAIWRSP